MEQMTRVLRVEAMVVAPALARAAEDQGLETLTPSAQYSKIQTGTRTLCWRDMVN